MAKQISEVLNERHEDIARKVSSFAASSQTARSLEDALKVAGHCA